MPKKKRTLPGPIMAGDRANYQTLLRAAANGDLAALSVLRRADGKQVTALCAMEPQDNGDTVAVPLAVLIEGDPYELFLDSIGPPAGQPGG